MSPGKDPNIEGTGKLCYGSGLTLETAERMLAAAEKEAMNLGVPLAIAISDAGGNLLAFHRMDNATLMSIQIAIDKAFTAVFGQQHTAQWSGLFREGGLIPLFMHERWITHPGGFPIIKDGTVLGGLGVSGGASNKGLYAARAALKAGGFSLKEVNDAITKSKV